LDIPWHGWATVDNIFLVVYFTELSLKLKTRSWRFFIDVDWAWNWLDFTIVASGVLDSWLKPLMHLFQKETSEHQSHANPVTSILRLFRILRVLRLVRLLRAVPALHLLLRGIMAALDAMKWVIVITILMLYGGSIVFTYVVGRGLIYGSEADVPHAALEKFGSVTDSLFSLFELMNGDVTVVDSIIKNAGGKLLFVAFMVISNWAILAILTSVVSDNMISASAQIHEEHKQLEIERDKQRSDRRLLRVFGLIDINGNGYITEDEWQDLMGNTDLQRELIDASGMDESDLHDLFECMVEHQMQKKVKNPRIDYGTFVTYIDDQHSVADKRTVMQINLRMRNLEQKMDRTLDRLNNGFIDPQTHLGVKRQKSGQVVNL
jgi:voltage-gated sodium channel